MMLQSPADAGTTQRAAGKARPATIVTVTATEAEPEPLPMPLPAAMPVPVETAEQPEARLEAVSGTAEAEVVHDDSDDGVPPASTGPNAPGTRRVEAAVTPAQAVRSFGCGCSNCLASKLHFIAFLCLGCTLLRCQLEVALPCFALVCFAMLW